MPSPELLQEMGKFHQELIAAEVMLDGGGLHPSSKGARVTFSGKDRTVRTGPFENISELVSGYWALERQLTRRSDRLGQTLSEPHARNLGH